MGHVRIFSGVFNDADQNYSFHEDQDRIGVPFLPIKKGINKSWFLKRVNGGIDDANFEHSLKEIQEFGINLLIFQIGCYL